MGDPGARTAPISDRPDPIAVGVRIRWAWLGLVARPAALAGNDLEDGWSDTQLERYKDRLILITPYDFGTGDPLDGEFGRYLLKVMSEVTAGGIRSVGWRYRGTPKAIPRKRTSDLDIYAPGDPMLDEYQSLVMKLRAGLPEDLSEGAADAMAALEVAAISKHRLWFRAGTDEERIAVGKTPGAAFALNAAVRKMQRNEPLYRVYRDTSSRPGGTLAVLAR